MPLTPGTRLGTYEILAPLGAGGMGEVYRARDTRLGREVAVKVLPAEMAASPDRLARFEREARTVAALNHPNIVTLYSVEDADGVRFLTMELVEGQTLVDHVTPGGLPLARLLELAIPLADALVAAHERGVVHRDLKPANVMVTREGRVKVLDFGLARSAVALREDQTLASPDTGAGEVLGTIPYMAPEQLRGDAADARSDLFALGIILYELATGRRPFTGASPADVTSAILRDAPEPLTRLRGDLPGELERIVSGCLEKLPRERIASALEVNNQLRSLRRGLERGEGAAPPPPPAKTASIAVLPFVNRSASADDEYFSDGLADELLNVLAKIKGLRVTARSSSFHFKGKNATIAEVGSALNVATVLEGSVRKAGNRIRVSVQLVQVADSSHLWSETYDRTLEDIFAVQDDIAQSVVKELRTTLLGEAPDSDATGQAKAEVAQAAKGRGTDPEAHRLYLLGRYFHERGTREELARGIEHLEQAVALDPRYADAWSELGMSHAHQAAFGWAPLAEGMTRARNAVERALSLEPDLAEAHAAMAWIRITFDWDGRGADESIRQALILAPGSARVLSGAGTLALTQGRVDDAIELLRRSVAQDPLSAQIALALGHVFLQAGRFQEAEAALRRALELAPQRAITQALLALTSYFQGRGEAALAEVMLEADPEVRNWARAIIHHGLGQGPESDEALRLLIERGSNNCAAQIAEVYACRGEVDAAFAWLERAYVQRDAGVYSMISHAHVRAFHDDPRWGAFRKKLGFDG